MVVSLIDDFNELCAIIFAANYGRVSITVQVGTKMIDNMLIFFIVVVVIVVVSVNFAVGLSLICFVFSLFNAILERYQVSFSKIKKNLFCQYNGQCPVLGTI